MNERSGFQQTTTRRRFLANAGAAGLAAAVARAAAADPLTTLPADQTTNIYFEKKLKAMRLGLYRNPPVDIIKDGFRPVGSRIADFAVVHHEGREHFFYIDRRMQEGTPFFPGHEIFFGHASTADFFAWTVHDPVMLIRPGTWEGAHVWAPFVMRDGERFVMIYTGLNDELSQDLGLAFSKDLFHWERWEGNPISPLKNARWAAWWPDEICSCRDPFMMRYEGRYYVTFTANTSEGASCVAMMSSADLKSWKDHGPILVGPRTGYEPSMWGGHTQGSCESTVLVRRGGRWLLLVGVKMYQKPGGFYLFISEKMDRFEFSEAIHFFDGGICEVVRDDGDRSLMAGGVGGCIKFGEVNWSDPRPRLVEVTREQLVRWQSVKPKLD